MNEAKSGVLPDAVITDFDAATARGAPVPWWIKIAAKLVLSRIVPSYSVRRRLRVSVHSFTADYAGNPDVLRHAINLHTSRTGSPPRSLLELGPGDSIANALYAAAAGTDTIWLADAGDFATNDMTQYQRAVDHIASDQPDFANRVDLSSRAAMLASINARYLTGGTASLRTIPNGSIDLAVSFAVLEHVRRAEFAQLLAELHRVLAPSGLAFHWIDLMDHLGGRLDNLRLPTWLWENSLFASSGFYTNRLRFSEIVTRARDAGFSTSIAWLARWPSLPTPRRAMAREFARLEDEELRIANFSLLLWHRTQDRRINDKGISGGAHET
jgi:SAM-dependent methyltransferase